MGDYIIKTSKEGMPVPVIDDSDLVDSLIAWEGFLEHPKNIGDGKITLGSGLTNPKWVKLYHQRGNVWSKEDNRRAVAEEVAARREWASRDIPNWDLLNPKSQKALLSYKYNYDFNRKNSPKMYKALEGKNWKEATRQMDATSDDPKFKKGLEDRRKREQRWFMSGVHDAETAREAMEKSSFWEKNKDRMMKTIGNAVKAGSKTGSWAYGGNISTPKTWGNLSMSEKADIMRVAVQNGITNLADIRDKYEELMGNYSARAMVDALYENNPTEEYLGEPEHHYDFTQTEEWANAHGYYPDERGHRDDRVKKPAHPTHPSRGSWEGNIFKFTDKGMESPNYTMFGVLDNNQDPQATFVYDNGIVLPEWTVTPQGNYVENPYDNIRLHYAKGGKIHIKPSHRGRFTELKKRTGHSASWFKAHGTPAQKKMAVFALNSRKWKHADGGPLVDAANAHIYDGTTEPTQQMNADDYIYTGAPSQYDFQVTAEAPTVYWDGFNWIGFNDLGQRVVKRPDFNPSGARVIENPQEFENARLAQARRKDINGTHRFAEKVRGVATLAAMAPMAGPLVEAATTVAPAAMPWIRRAMELGVRPTSTIVRGLSSYVPQASKAVPYFTGLDKTAMGMAGLFGMKDAYEGYKSGDKHWANALAEGALSAMMATELAPAVKYANELAGRGFNFKTPATPKITEENVASITPEQWTAAQDAAIARGDMTEAQRLRDLHFQVGAPNSITHEVFHHGNKEPMNWYTFDPKRIGTTDEGYSGAGYYFAPTRPASQYVKEHLPHTLGPHGEQNAGLSGGKYHRYVYLNGETKYKPIRDHDWTTHTDLPFVDNKPIEVVVGDNRQIKLADAVTYDDKGVRIPLGERDNFNVNDIRYLKGTDIQGNEYELPVRTMRGGIEGPDGQLLSDEELVNNWKRSQDFYKMRLRNAGLSKDGRTYIKNKEEAVKIAQSYDPDMGANEILEGIDDSGGAFAIARGDSGYGIVTKELNTMGKQRKGTTNSAYVHEDAHLMRGPEDGDIEDIDWSALNLKKDEAAARGTQIKSMLGIKDNTPVTAKQLEYMKDNFVRLTGMDNAMQAFLNSITDMESAAKWISKNSYSKGGALNLLGYDFLKHPKGWKGL